MDETLAERLRQRADHACEYCHMPQAFYPTVPFPIDPISAQQHGGPTVFGNLARTRRGLKRSYIDTE
jgi:hypothetical protein